VEGMNEKKIGILFH